MRILLIHSDYLNYNVKNKTPVAEDIEEAKKEGSFDDSLVVFTAVEKDDENNPEVNGSIKLIGDPSVTDVFDADSTNKYFIGSVRQKFALIQTIVPKQEYVDLSKWIKQTYTIKV